MVDPRSADLADVGKLRALTHDHRGMKGSGKVLEAGVNGHMAVENNDLVYHLAVGSYSVDMKENGRKLAMVGW